MKTFILPMLLLTLSFTAMTVHSEKFMLTTPNGYIPIHSWQAFEKSYRLLQFIPEENASRNWRENWLNMFGILIYPTDSSLQSAENVLKTAISKEASKCIEHFSTGEMHHYLENGFPMIIVFSACGAINKKHGKLTLTKVITSEKSIIQLYISKKVAPFDNQNLPMDESMVKQWRRLLDKSYLCPESWSECTLKSREQDKSSEPAPPD